MVDHIVRTFTTQNTAAQGANVTNPDPSGPTHPLEELFKYSGPHSACMGRQYYWDQILNMSVWAPTPQLDACKAHFLPRLQNYGSLPDLPDSQKVHINLVRHERHRFLAHVRRPGDDTTGNASWIQVRSVGLLSGPCPRLGKEL